MMDWFGGSLTIYLLAGEPVQHKNLTLGQAQKTVDDFAVKHPGQMNYALYIPHSTRIEPLGRQP